MQGLVTVFGGSGFVGSQIVRALARRGARVRVAARRPGRGYKLPMLGDVGQIEIVQANIRDAPSVARALEGAEACVNAVAVLYESGRQRFEALHVTGAGAVAQAAAERGIGRFVHLSALGADAHSPSKYARSKAAGEAAVRGAIPTATIVRPSAVFVADVAAAVAEAVLNPAAASLDYELAGPQVYSFRRLMELMLAEIGHRRLLVPLPFPVARLLGMAGDAMAAASLPPPITSDQVELLRRDNVATAGAPGLIDLGVTPSALEPIIPTYLYRYRTGGQYAELSQAAAALPPR